MRIINDYMIINHYNNVQQSVIHRLLPSMVITGNNLSGKNRFYHGKNLVLSIIKYNIIYNILNLLLSI